MRALIGGVACAIMPTGCTTTGTPDPDPTPPASQGPRLLVATEKPNGSAQAAISGLLGVDSLGCITVGPNTLIAPFGSELKPDGTIHLEGIGDYAIGDELPVVAGSVVEADAAPAAYKGCEGSSLSHVVSKD